MKPTNLQQPLKNEDGYSTNDGAGDPQEVHVVHPRLRPRAHAEWRDRRCTWHFDHDGTSVTEMVATRPNR